MGPLTDRAHRCHPVRTSEDVGALRRTIADLASRVGGLRPGEVELVATELATNLVRHTTSGGYVLSRRTDDGIELVAVDRGPGGLRPAAVATTLGPRPAGRVGLGVGLAGVARLASLFDYYSDPAGTVVLARLSVPRPPGPGRWVEWGAVNVPRTGELEPGDVWAVACNRRLSVLLVDGLGHGPPARRAAQAALAVFDQQPTADLEDFVRRAHHAMRTTRGGVLGIAAIDPERNEVSFVGVGNVMGRVVIDQDRQHLLSRNGVLGAQLAPPTCHVTRARWATAASLVLTSDGIRHSWDPTAYPGLLGHHPTVVAAVLHRDHGLANDDATVVVIQDRRNHRP